MSAVQIQIYTAGQPTGQIYLDGSRRVNKIGKTASAQVKLDDPAVSRVHAVIEVSKAGVWLIDMGSSVGTTVNGARIHKVQLNGGEQIVIGQTMLVVTLGQAYATAPPTQAAAVPMQPAAPVQPAAPIQPAAAPVQPPAATQQAPLPTLSPFQQTAPPAAAAPSAQSAMDQAVAASMTARPVTKPSIPTPTEKTNGPSPIPAAFRGDSVDTLSDSDDPAVRRMRESARRNRFIAAAVLFSVVVATLVFVYVGLGREIPEVEEAAHYSDFEGATKSGTPTVAAFDTKEERDADRYRYAVVQKDQTFESLAFDFYQNKERAALVAEANPLSKEGAVTRGTEVRLPRYLEHTVRSGDTLAVIAEKYLGNSEQHPRIFEANTDKLNAPTAIEVGMRLRIPLL